MPIGFGISPFLSPDRLWHGERELHIIIYNMAQMRKQVEATLKGKLLCNPPFGLRNLYLM